MKNLWDSYLTCNLQEYTIFLTEPWGFCLLLVSLI